MAQPFFAGVLRTGGDFEVHRLDLGYVIQPDASPVAGERCPILAYAVRHPAGLLLFDTGLGEPHPVIDQLYEPERKPIASALADIDLSPADVDTLVNCHLHFDHCGANPAFPGVPIYAQSIEHEATRDPIYTLRDRVDFPEADIRHLDGETDIAPSITIVPTPGHSPGHQSLVLDTTDGTVILVGQAAYTAGEFDDPEASAPAGADSAWDPAAARRSLRSLHSLNPISVLFAHDHAVWTQ